MEDAPFVLTETHRQFRDSLRRFVDDRIAPHAAAADRDATFPQASFDACVEMELPALGIPVAYGGAGADMITQAIMAEEVARACASTAVTLLISKLGMLPVMNWASEELKQAYLPRIATGESQASYCLSEADAGSHRPDDVCRARAFTFRHEWHSTSGASTALVVAGEPAWICGERIPVTGQVAHAFIEQPARRTLSEHQASVRVGVSPWPGHCVVVDNRTCEGGTGGTSVVRGTQWPDRTPHDSDALGLINWDSDEGMLRLRRSCRVPGHCSRHGECISPPDGSDAGNGCSSDEELSSGAITWRTQPSPHDQQADQRNGGNDDAGQNERGSWCHQGPAHVSGHEADGQG